MQPYNLAAGGVFQNLAVVKSPLTCNDGYCFRYLDKDRVSYFKDGGKHTDFDASTKDIRGLDSITRMCDGTVYETKNGKTTSRKDPNNHVTKAGCHLLLLI